MRWAALVVSVLVGVVGCSASPTPPSSPGASQSPGAPAPVATPIPPAAWARVESFVAAFVSRDYRKARTYAAEKRAAWRYLAHQELIDGERKSKGKRPAERRDPTFDEAQGRVVFLVDGVPTTWTDWRFDDQGKVSSWAIDLGKVKLRIA